MRFGASVKGGPAGPANRRLEIPGLPARYFDHARASQCQHFGLSPWLGPGVPAPPGRAPREQNLPAIAGDRPQASHTGPNKRPRRGVLRTGPVD